MTNSTKRVYVYGCVAVFATTILLMVAYGGLSVALSPSYIDVHVPLSHELAWWDISHTTLTAEDESGCYYVLRKCATADTAVDGWRDCDEIVSHIEKAINAAGYTSRRASTCTEFLPESYFLTGNCYEYRNLNDLDDRSSVMLAVWPYDEQNKYFRIVLVTVKPSYWNDFGHAVD
jgi:hypothetical protein